MPRPFEAPGSSASYGVRLVRGPFVELAPHPRHTDREDDFLVLAQELRAGGARLAADLFGGAGGLSLGLQDAGFTVVFSVDKDPYARRTHAHHFAGMSVDWDLSEAANVEKVAELCREARVELIAGGPPCQPFSKAGRSKIRHRVEAGLRDPHDERRDLWRSFLEVVSLVRPAAMVMENVPDMALDREMFILRSMVEELEQLDYSVAVRILEAWRYRVPQFRQRLLMVAMRDNVRFDWPAEEDHVVTVWDAIGDLPKVEGGWRPDGGAEGWTPYAAPKTDFQERMRRRLNGERNHQLFDHITRPVRDDDRVIFDSMTPETRYTDLDISQQRYRADIFQDKYKRLNPQKLARTITAHIAKDGYWYIHPFQPRTLTVREAARLQTFPDDYRFDGPPSAAFRQIGNAVPPFLGEVIGRSLLSALNNYCKGEAQDQQPASLLGEWEHGSSYRQSLPWLWAKSRWIFLVAETLLDRAPTADIKKIWPQISDLAHPAQLSSDGRDKQAQLLRNLGQVLDRSERAERLVQMIGVIAADPTILTGGADHIKTALGVPDSIAELTVLTASTDGALDSGEDETAWDEPVLVGKGVLRVAARFKASEVDRRNRMTDGRIAIARMVGLSSKSREAQRNLIELANGICRPTQPLCHCCPLEPGCEKHLVDDDQLILW